MFKCYNKYYIYCHISNFFKKKTLWHSQGDSGGPLVLEEEDFETNVGVVSAGYGCGVTRFPSLYIRVDSYLDWIDEKVYGSCARSAFK